MFAKKTVRRHAQLAAERRDRWRHIEAFQRAVRENTPWQAALTAMPDAAAMGCALAPRGSRLLH